MFADDTKINSVHVIKSFDDSPRLQRDIDRLIQCLVALVQCYRFKCKVMQIGLSLSASYTMRDCASNVPTDLKLVYEEKDFGIW